MAIRLPASPPWRDAGPFNRPVDAPDGTIPLLDAVEATGKAIFGSEWTDAELAARDWKARQNDIWVAINRRLAELHPEFFRNADGSPSDPGAPFDFGDRHKERAANDGQPNAGEPFAPLGDLPQLDEEEQRRIHSKYADLHAAEEAARKRRNRATHELLGAFRSGTVSTALSRLSGGPVLLRAADWLPVGAERAFEKGFFSADGPPPLKGWALVHKGELDRFLDSLGPAYGASACESDPAAEPGDRSGTVPNANGIVPLSELSDFLNARVDKTEPESHWRDVAERHFAPRAIPEKSRWRPAWKQVPAIKKLRQGEKPKSGNGNLAET